jgi:phosphate uptake regulator
MVLRELIRILRSEDLGVQLRHDLGRMRDLAYAQLLQSSEYYWRGACSPAQRQAVYDHDIEINRLERAIRKRLLVYLSGATPPNQAECLAVMCMVKDMERIGDYAKNLVEAAALYCGALPDDQLVCELADTYKTIRQVMKLSAPALDGHDVSAARELTALGRGVIRRCDAIVERISQADYCCALAVKLALGTRYYKRVCGHNLNLLSSVFMPVEDLDYVDEASPAGGSE